MILDAESLALAPEVEVLIGESEKLELPGRLKTELFASVVELNTDRSEEHTSELQSRLHLVCRLLLEKKKTPVEYSNSRPAGEPSDPSRPSGSNRTGQI